MEVKSPAPLRGDPMGELQELERINKEIETMRQEVELEQRRLSRYQTVQADASNIAPGLLVSNCVNAYRPNLLSSCKDLRGKHCTAGKYVVDNSKPRTDLEYDPMSNFSAGLRSGSASCQEQKGTVQGMKRKEALLCGQKNDPDDDSIPSSPDKKIFFQKLDCVVDKPHGSAQQLNDSKVMSVSLDSPLKCSNAKKCCVPSTCAPRVGLTTSYKCDIDNNPCNHNDCKFCEKRPVEGNVIDLTECSQDPESELKVMTTLPDQSLAPYEQNIFEKFTSLVSHDSLPKHDKTSAAKLPSPCRQRTIQTQTKTVAFNCQSPAKSVPAVVPVVQNLPSKVPVPIQVNVLINQTSSGKHQHEEGSQDNNHFESPSTSFISVESHLTNSSEPIGQPSLKMYKEGVTIISSTDEELNCSDVELSDSDPEEECYRIFMEANKEDMKGCEEETSVSTPGSPVPPEVFPGKKRVAHEAKHIESVTKSRPQPQVLVPLREPAASGYVSQSSVTPKIQQVQQRASMLTASVKGGQAFVSLTSQRQPETRSTATLPSKTAPNTQPVPVQNAYMNYLSLGTTVIEVGNNLHLILPEGTFPLPKTSSNSPITSVLTPVGHVTQSTHLGVKQICHRASITPVQRYHTTAPVLIPAQTLRTSSASASAHSNPLASSTAIPAFHTANAKAVPTKRKLKQLNETTKDKVPHDLRQRYVNMFTEEFLKTTANVNDAFERAVAEEKTVYNRSANKLKYLSVAVNSLKRLKSQSAVATKDENKGQSPRLKGNIPLNLNTCRGTDDTDIFESLKDYILPEEKLVERNYPVQHPEKPGSAALFADCRKRNADPLKRICCRCGATYSVNRSGKHVRKEECTYHYGKGVENRVPGGVETRYSCCQGVMGAPGCQVFQLHVHDFVSLDGFVSTRRRHPSDKSCPGVYSLDCEMCYTVNGLELSRVTAVNSSLQVVYDTFIRPDSEVIDYNTRFSGISEVNVKGNNTSIRDLQETLLSFISADTILIGHSLETDLCALKLFHGRVVDTSLVFPHHLGPPHKLSLNNLTAEYLRRIIQESVCGHDTADDATACMELMMWRAKEDGKLKK